MQAHSRDTFFSTSFRFRMGRQRQQQFGWDFSHLLVLVFGSVLGCADHGNNAMKDKTTDTVLIKHNLRKETKDGWLVEVWTNGRATVAGRLSVGIRISRQD